MWPCLNMIWVDINRHLLRLISDSLGAFFSLTLLLIWDLYYYLFLLFPSRIPKLINDICTNIDPSLFGNNLVNIFYFNLFLRNNHFPRYLLLIFVFLSFRWCRHYLTHIDPHLLFEGLVDLEETDHPCEMLKPILALAKINDLFVVGESHHLKCIGHRMTLLRVPIFAVDRVWSQVD